KFRDEVRPRFGVMRGREFLMKDAYSFDLDEKGARLSYYTQMLAYLRTFQRMGIQAVPMKAASGPIGGDLSHEFIVLAPTGESEVFYDIAFEEIDWRQSDIDYGDERDLHRLFKQVSSTYAATDETHDEELWSKVDEDKRRTGRGIEVGHIFYFGDLYSRKMGLKVSGHDGNPIFPMMGSYGVGVSRLVGGIIEASHDEAGIVWPEAVAPWRVGLVTMRADDQASEKAAEQLYGHLVGAGFSVAAVALGVAALIIVMSVMNGFRAELFDKIVGLSGHAIIQGVSGGLPDWQQIADTAKKTPGVTSALPIIEQPLMATSNG